MPKLKNPATHQPRSTPQINKNSSQTCRNKKNPATHQPRSTKTVGKHVEIKKKPATHQPRSTKTVGKHVEIKKTGYPCGKIDSTDQ